MPFLILHYGGMSEAFEVTRPTVLGRFEDCDIILNIESVSRHHARLHVASGQLVIEDLGSHNGTKVNGQRLAQPHLLQPGDEVQLGKKIRLICPDQATLRRYKLQATGPAAISFRCPGCDALLRADPYTVGQAGSCQECGLRLVVPHTGGGIAEPVAIPLPAPTPTPTKSVAPHNQPAAGVWIGQPVQAAAHFETTRRAAASQPLEAMPCDRPGATVWVEHEQPTFCGEGASTSDAQLDRSVAASNVACDQQQAALAESAQGPGTPARADRPGLVEHAELSRECALDLPDVHTTESSWWDNAVIVAELTVVTLPDAAVQALTFVNKTPEGKSADTPSDPLPSLAQHTRINAEDAGPAPGVAAPATAPQELQTPGANDGNDADDAWQSTDWIAAAATIAEPDTTATITQTVCALCTKSLAGDGPDASAAITCPTCGQSYHLACWQWNRGCQDQSCPPVNSPINRGAAPLAEAAPRGIARIKAHWRNWLAATDPAYGSRQWDLSLLIASLLAFGVGMLSLGIPNAVTMLVAVAYKLKYRRRFSHALFALIMLVSLAGIAAGIMVFVTGPL
jgi:DNA-directed RNA polymerase subunit RPC12/RpoP